MMKNQKKQYELCTCLVALLSLTQNSNFHILADENGEFLSTRVITTLNEWSRYDGASALGTLFEENHEALWFALNFLWKSDLQILVF
jgi:hypothetical protein